MIHYGGLFASKARLRPENEKRRGERIERQSYSVLRSEGREMPYTVFPIKQSAFLAVKHLNGR